MMWAKSFFSSSSSDLLPKWFGSTLQSRKVLNFGQHFPLLNSRRDRLMQFISLLRVSLMSGKRKRRQRHFKIHEASTTSPAEAPSTHNIWKNEFKWKKGREEQRTWRMNPQEQRKSSISWLERMRWGESNERTTGSAAKAGERETERGKLVWIKWVASYNG